jgi:hypothetical protein
MVLRSTQPVTEMNTRNFSWRVKRPLRSTDNLTTSMCCRLSRNLGASTSWIPKGLPRPLMGLVYLYMWVYQDTKAWPYTQIKPFMIPFFSIQMLGSVLCS